MPVGLPPGMDPGMAKELVEYLRANPEVARQTYNEAQRLLQVRLPMQVATTTLLLEECTLLPVSAG